MVNQRDEEILKAVHFYRYMTAIDVAYRLFSPSSKTHVREILSDLCGGKDQQENQYLYRFARPKAQAGNVERIFVLGNRGRDYLVNNFGLTVNWYFRPSRAINYTPLTHSLALTRFLVAAHWWCKKHKAIKLVETKISYVLANVPGKDDHTIIPDGWLLLERSDGMRGSIILEIDRGTEFKEQFQKHIRSRLYYVQSGEYEKEFGEKSVIYAYVSEGHHPRRLKTMQQWAMEVLQEEKRENWASLFRFTQVELEKVYETPLFEGAVWHSPNRVEPHSLF